MSSTHSADVREQVADLGAALAARGELPVAAASGTASRSRAGSRVSGWSSVTCLPWSAVSFGFGSNESTCDTPPLMNRKMTDFAFAGKCGGFGASGSAAPPPAARHEQAGHQQRAGDGGPDERRGGCGSSWRHSTVEELVAARAATRASAAQRGRLGPGCPASRPRSGRGTRRRVAVGRPSAAGCSAMRNSSSSRRRAASLPARLVGLGVDERVVQEVQRLRRHRGRLPRRRAGVRVGPVEQAEERVPRFAATASGRRSAGSSRRRRRTGRAA